MSQRLELQLLQAITIFRLQFSPSQTIWSFVAGVRFVNRTLQYMQRPFCIARICWICMVFLLHDPTDPLNSSIPVVRLPFKGPSLQAEGSVTISKPTCSEKMIL